MMYTLLKLFLTAGVIVLISEVAKRSTLLGGLLAALPLVSLFSFIWIYVDTGDTKKIGELSHSVFWLVLPTLPMFLLFPTLLKKQFHFALSLGICIGVTVGLYVVLLVILRKVGVQL